MKMHIRLTLSAVIAAALLLPPRAMADIGVIDLSVTGQTTCYSDNGSTIKCTATGQDGDMEAGADWPSPRFLVDNKTVTDNLTGLMWAKNANLLGTRDNATDVDGTPKDGRVRWQHALDYIKQLNTQSYLGHNDWRLPNANELESLLDAENHGLALPQNHPFENVQKDFPFWASTSCAGAPDSAWACDMNIGYLACGYKLNDYYVWPVRAGLCGAGDNSTVCLPKTGQTRCFKDNGTETACTGTGQDGAIQAGVAWPNSRLGFDNATVTDNLTGLVWSRNANLIATRDPGFDADDTAADGRITWQHALDYMMKLNAENYLGHKDWRLPNRKELRSLADYSRHNTALPNASPFTNVQPYIYWTSTSDAFSTGNAWVFVMDEGSYSSSPAGKTYFYYAWPVRSGLVDITTTTTTVPSTTTTSIRKLCPASSALGEDNPDVEKLRALRDGPLAQSAAGRRIIQMYYDNAEGINKALERSPALRAVTRTFFEAAAMLVGNTH